MKTIVRITLAVLTVSFACLSSSCPEPKKPVYHHHYHKHKSNAPESFEPVEKF